MIRVTRYVIVIAMLVAIASNLVAGDTNGTKDVFVRGVPY